jgi:hypothetical protein
MSSEPEKVFKIPSWTWKVVKYHHNFQLELNGIINIAWQVAADVADAAAATVAVIFNMCTVKNVHYLLYIFIYLQYLF